MDDLKALLRKIEDERSIVIRYHYTEQNLFAKEPEIKKAVKAIEQRLSMMRQRYEDKRTRIKKKCKEMEERQNIVLKELTHRREGLNFYRQMVNNEHLVPDTYHSDDKMLMTHQDCHQLLSQLRGVLSIKNVNQLISLKCNSQDLF